MILIETLLCMDIRSYTIYYIPTIATMYIVLYMYATFTIVIMAKKWHKDLL